MQKLGPNFPSKKDVHLHETQISMDFMFLVVNDIFVVRSSPTLHVLDLQSFEREVQLHQAKSCFCYAYC